MDKEDLRDALERIDDMVGVFTISDVFRYQQEQIEQLKLQIGELNEKREVEEA